MAFLLEDLASGPTERRPSIRPETWADPDDLYSMICFKLHQRDVLMISLLRENMEHHQVTCKTVQPTAPAAAAILDPK